MSDFDFSEKFITKNNLFEIASIAAVVGGVMFYAFFSGSEYGIYTNIRNSSLTELAISIISFFILGFLSTLIIVYKIYSSSKISIVYGRITVVLTCAIYLLLTFEVFDIYWVALRNNSKFWSCIFSGLFFTPFVLLVWEIAQRIFFYIFGINWLNPANSPTIQEMINTEVSKKLHNELQYSIRKTYNNKNEVIATSFFEKIEDGHWLCVKTSGNAEAGEEVTFYAEHIRTHENFERYGYASSVATDKLINSEKVFGSKEKKSKGGILLD